MLRFLIRRLPRFGFLTLFAAMLLFVSGAGWVKFHYDLYLEEERLLADLAKAECDLRFARIGDMPGSGPPQEPPWLRLPEQFRRIQTLRITYSDIEHRPLIQRAATLPSVDDFEARHRPATRAAPPTTPFPGTESYFRDVGVELPPLPDVPTPDLEQPLPVGEALLEDEIVATIEAWRNAWSKPTLLPSAGIVRSDSTSARHPDFRETIEIRGKSARLQARGQDVLIGNGRKLSELSFEPERRHEFHRQLDRDTIDVYVDDQGSLWLESATGRKKFEMALLNVPAPIRPYALEKDLTRSAIKSIQRTDGGLVRIDFRPKKKEFPTQGVEDEAVISVVLRPDRDFAVEAYDVRVERTGDTLPEPVDWTPRFRSVSSDHGSAYLLDAYAIESLSPNGRSASPPPYGIRTWSERLAYDFEQEPPAKLFEPATYGAIELPPPRPLPVWRWYRVTFILSLALFALIVARWAFARRRRRVTNLQPAEATDLVTKPV